MGHGAAKGESHYYLYVLGQNKGPPGRFQALPCHVQNESCPWEWVARFLAREWRMGVGQGGCFERGTKGSVVQPLLCLPPQRSPGWVISQETASSFLGLAHL